MKVSDAKAKKRFALCRRQLLLSFHQCFRLAFLIIASPFLCENFWFMNFMLKFGFSSGSSGRIKQFARVAGQVDYQLRE
jgi:hypothetical protein